MGASKGKEAQPRAQDSAFHNMAPTRAACTSARSVIDVDGLRGAAQCASAGGCYRSESGGEEGEKIRAGARGLSEDTSFSQGATRGCRGRQSRSRFATCLGSDEGREDTMRLEDPRATSRKSSHGMGHHESDAHLAWNAGAKVGKKGPKEEATVAKGPTGAAGSWNRSTVAVAAATAAGVADKVGDGKAHHASKAGAACGAASAANNNLSVEAAEWAETVAAADAVVARAQAKLQRRAVETAERSTGVHTEVQCDAEGVGANENIAAVNLQAGLADGQGQSAGAGATGSHRAESWRATAYSMWRWCTVHRAVAVWCVVAALSEGRLLAIG